MRRIVLYAATSLDGYIEAPGRDISWHQVSEEVHAYHNQVLDGMDAFLSGRVTWELMAAFWPTAEQNPVSTPPMREFAGIWVRKPKIVYSKTLQQAGWNTTIVREVVPSEVMALKAMPGNDLVLSGANLAASFIRHDLVDEYRLYVQPVAIGRGTPLFPQDAKVDGLRLTETKRFGNGVVMLRYAVERGALGPSLPLR